MSIIGARIASADARINGKVKSFIHSHWWPIAIYTLLAATAILSYQSAIDLMNVQTAWLMIVKSNVTVSLIALYGLWGVMSDTVGKRRGWSQRKSWMVFVVGIIAMTFFFRIVGGYETVWE